MLSFSFEKGFDVPDERIDFFSNNVCEDDSKMPLSKLNKCLNYIDNQSILVDLSGLEDMYSLNIQGTGMTANNLSSVVGLKGGKEVQLPPEQFKTIFFEGRKWKRHKYSFESLISIPIEKTDYDKLRISFSPMIPGQRYMVSSIWYR